MPRQRRAGNAEIPQGALDPDHDDLDEHVEAICEALEVITTSKNPPKHSDLPALRPYIKYARMLSLTVSPFLNVQMLCKTELAYLHNATDDRRAPEHSDIYWEIVWNMPGPRKRFNTVLKSLWLKNVKGRGPGAEFVTMIHDAADSGRFDVTIALKTGVVEILPRERGNAIEPPLVKNNEKALRGFHHIAFGEQIVGIAYRAKYRRNPGLYCERVVNGEIEHTTDCLPSFLFRDNILFDKRRPEEGLGLGYVFTRALALVLTTPSTAFGDKSTGRKSSRAFLMGWDAVPPTVAASIAAQTYIALSDMKEFGPEHGPYEVDILFESLAALFRSSDPASELLMENITNSLPHLTDGPSSIKKTRARNKNPPPNPLAHIIQARRAAEKDSPSPEDDEEEQDPAYEQHHMRESRKRRSQAASQHTSDQDPVDETEDELEQPRKRRVYDEDADDSVETPRHAETGKGKKYLIYVTTFQKSTVETIHPSHPPLSPSNVMNSPLTPRHRRVQSQSSTHRQHKAPSSNPTANSTRADAPVAQKKPPTAVYGSQRRLPARTGTSASASRLSAN
ncbi:hypothetical protein BJ165DRAFT_1589175 [Panaeolus papilionaceus]|nr:hypothetical protein BJ165DRAFT_1589175 [Panaeolus papilionaceus]